MKNTNNPPLEYKPRKRSMMNSDIDALYYTDMLYPAYGRAMVAQTQESCRDLTHKAFDLRWEARSDPSKSTSHLVTEILRRLADRNLLLMMQANLDVLNGKMTIMEARGAIRDELEINEWIIPGRIERQIALDNEKGISRHIEEYLDLNTYNDKSAQIITP